MIKAFKPVGLTPLSLLHLIKEKYPKYKNKKIAYAGRLDPMAEGLMIYLDQEIEKKNRKKYEKLAKVYQFDVLLGIQTDSFDILGLAKETDKKTDINAFIEKNIGTKIQEYPAYSYIRVRGKSLFWWARNKKLNEITIPSKKIKISKFNVINKYKMNSSQLIKYIKERISLIEGDFRQQEILEAWKELLAKYKQFECVRFMVECSGGTYVRALANEMNGVAISIKRLQVGDHDLSDVIYIK